MQLVRRLGPKAVFAEGSASPKLAQTLAAETGARIGGTLHADGLAPAGSGAETYEAMMRYNLGTITAALLRLTAPQQMGAIFRAMAVTAPGWPVPAGFGMGPS